MIDILRTLIICVSLHPISNQQKIDMQKNLVIVESPAKAKTIEKFLGKDYKVMSSYGHIRDLKTKDFSIDLEHNYAPEYVIPSDKKKLVTELKNEAKKAEQVWLASDEDREGEAISWHLYEVLGLKPENTKRIVFHEITKNAILHAIETPRDINIDLVNAQQARRILDRIVGFELSPILWRKVKPALSAGRVQSVAVRLIVEREREINEFVSEAAYRVIASFILPDGTTILKAELNRRLKDKDRHFYFLEMNTRLQVEHPITEEVVGVDLVKEQIRIANNEVLHLRQEDLFQRGHAIECRICAEDTENNFMPSPGIIRQLTEPNGIGVRIDSYVYEGYEIPVYYDPMIGKLIVWATTRAYAIERMRRVLYEYKITGLKTNLSYLKRIMHNPDFVKGEYNTLFIAKNARMLQRSNGNNEEIENIAMIAAYMDYLMNLEENTSTQLVDTRPISRWREFGLQKGVLRI